MKYIQKAVAVLSLIAGLYSIYWSIKLWSNGELAQAVGFVFLIFINLGFAYLNWNSDKCWTAINNKFPYSGSGFMGWKRQRKD